MRKPLLLLLVALSVLLIAVGAVMLADGARREETARQASEAEVMRISVEELHARLQGTMPPLVWELRTPQSYAQQHVPGSRLVTLEEIDALAAGLDRKQAIVVLCA